MSLYALAAVVDTSLQAGFPAVLIFVLLRFIRLSVAVVNLTDRKTEVQNVRNLNFGAYPAGIGFLHRSFPVAILPASGGERDPQE